MRTLFHRAAAGLFVTAALAGCDSTQLLTNSADRILPTVTVSSAAVVDGPSGGQVINIREPASITVDASDNAAIVYVVTRVIADGQQVQRDSQVVSSSATFSGTFPVSLAGVRSGQQLVIRTDVGDAGGNTGTASVSAVAYDPDVPVVGLLNPSATVIVGGTYTVSIRAVDALGLSKVGYVVPGSSPALGDSALFSAPLSATDTVTFSLPVPAGLTVGSTFEVSAFAENANGLRGVTTPFTVQVGSVSADVQAPLLFQNIPARAEADDTLDFTARDPDGVVNIIGFIARDSAGNELYRRSETLSSPAQQVVRRMAFNAPVSLKGRGMFIVGFATDASGKTGYAVPSAATLPATDISQAARDPLVYSFGSTMPLPPNSLGADIAVDSTRARVYVSNILRNELNVFDYGSVLSPLAAVAVGSQPWGMTVDNSGSLLLVANSGGTNISKVNLLTRKEDGRIKTANTYVYDVSYSKDETSGGYKYEVKGPIDYSDRPQYIAQSASGALYYSARPTATATPGTLRRIDNFLDPNAEPRQIWQYGSEARGQWVIFNSDAVDVIKGENGVPDLIIICDHTPGASPTTSTCVQDGFIPNAIAALRAAPINANVEAVKDLSVASLALPDTNFVAVGGDRRRVAFGEANTGNRAGRVLMVFDPSGTPAGSEVYNAPIEVADLTNNASDRVFGLALNRTSTNVGVHGEETFFADTDLRLQGKFATFNTGAGIVFHPLNDGDSPADSTWRVAFVASGDRSIQIVDSYSYRLRGRIPLRQNLYGALRAVLPTAAEKAADPTLSVKLFGLTPEGIVMIDVRKSDIDNVPR